MRIPGSGPPHEVFRSIDHLAAVTKGTMLRVLAVQDWLTSDLPIIDVRSPGEFTRGHIPGARNLALFSDEERAVVGTIYKQQGRDPAVLEGLRIVGPKLPSIVEDARQVAPDGRIRVHCWRGGERSGSVAWLLDKAGFHEVLTLKLGYKGFRAHVQSALASPPPLKVLGGYTGTGKTGTLKVLAALGEQTLDLEALARHKGSAFGALGEDPQPTTEQFENSLWHAIRRCDGSRPIWVEDESMMIGRVCIPQGFFVGMRTATLYFADMSIDERADRLVIEYGRFPTARLAEAVMRIGKRLGPQHCKAALAALDAGDLKRVALITLHYYDKSYRYGAAQRDPKRIITLPTAAADLPGLAARLIALP